MTGAPTVAEHLGPDGSSTLLDRLRARLEAGQLDLPELGGGETSARWRALAELARADVSEARIAEAHVDAVQILLEADRQAHPGSLYGVWASEHPRWALAARRTSHRTHVLRGAKAFCSGAGLVDRALVTISRVSEHDRSRPSVLLVDVDLRDLDPGRIDVSSWTTAALADTVTAVVDLTGLEVDDSQIVHGSGWYLTRPGFWDGAVGPAACWAGAALGLIDVARRSPPSDPHGRAHLGALVALAWHLEATLDAAGRQVDERGPQGTVAEARSTALTVRHLVDVACAEVQERFARALGPRPLVSRPEVEARNHALSIYRRQCHAESDLQALGDLHAEVRTHAGDPAAHGTSTDDVS